MTEASSRLYMKVAGRLIEDLNSGKYPVGAKLPAERELTTIYDVSRPVIREAIIALEVQGLVEVKVGSGVYVKALPGQHQESKFNISAIELTEARLLIEAETAALAATQAQPDEISEMEGLIQQIAAENLHPSGSDKADRAFHLAIAKASRNNALIEVVERLWELRNTSPEAALLHEKARTANIKPVVAEHTLILDALKAGDPAAARSAMRNHLTQVLDSLLFATEERAIAEARRSVQAKRDRFTRATA